MSRSRLAPHLALCCRLLVGAVALMLVFSTQETGVAHAEEYVFSIGILLKVDQSTITLGFEDGTTATYRIGPETTVRSHDGDERAIADFELGSPVLIVTREGDPLAVTVVDGGPDGFPAEAGPDDIRGHEGPCGCTAESTLHAGT